METQSKSTKSNNGTENVLYVFALEFMHIVNMVHEFNIHGTTYSPIEIQGPPRTVVIRTVVSYYGPCELFASFVQQIIIYFVEMKNRLVPKQY